MKLKTLERALAFLLADDSHPLTPDEFEDTLKARDEIIALANHCEDGLDTDCSIVSWYAFSNLMNVATYDDFGKIYKEHHNCKRGVTKLYREACRDLICEELTDGQIDGVADFLTDLWLDNESGGCHNSDGTFTEDAIAEKDKGINKLGDIINKLYHHRGLSPDDITAIELYIH